MIFVLHAGRTRTGNPLDTLYLTNIQQFYKSPSSENDEPSEMIAVLEKKMSAKKISIKDFNDRIAAR